MAIFGERKESASTPAAPKSVATAASSSSARTVLGRGVAIEGVLKGEGEVVVEGSFKGEVNLSGSLVVGAKGHVEANVQARVVTVEGTITGNVTVSERMDIRATGVIEGDITTPRVSVAEGATIRGRVNMSPSLETGARKTSAATSLLSTSGRAAVKS